jgi:ankyrin repeat protein
MYSVRILLACLILFSLTKERSGGNQFFLDTLTKRTDIQLSNSPRLADSLQASDCVKQLIEAASKNDLKSAELLLAKGCDVNGKIHLNAYSWDAPLRHVFHQNDTSMAKLLLEHGADPNIDLGRMLSPFSAAASGGSNAMLKLLYRYNGDVNRYNSYNEGHTSPLLSAIAGNNVDNAKFIIEHGGKINPDSLNGFNSPLIASSSHRSLELMKLLFLKGADVNATETNPRLSDCSPCTDGYTVLHHVVKMFSYETENMNPYLELILSQKPNVNIETLEGYSALDYACSQENIPLVDKLINAGAKLESKGFSALHCAALKSNYKMVEHLLKKGADPNVTTGNGQTALMISYECCGDGFGEGITPEERKKTTELLLSYHADPNKKDDNGVSFLDLCKQDRAGRELIKDLLIKKGLLKKG